MLLYFELQFCPVFRRAVSSELVDHFTFVFPGLAHSFCLFFVRNRKSQVDQIGLFFFYDTVYGIFFCRGTVIIRRDRNLISQLNLVFLKILIGFLLDCIRDAVTEIAKCLAAALCQLKLCGIADGLWLNKIGLFQF